MPMLPMSGGAMPMQTVTVDGDAASETHDMCVCSTLYHTMPNMPATSSEYENESRKMPKDAADVWTVRPLNG
jgi:3'-phosphoadenosine 5'-phosphosulfate (PAPS) 3'-phosphatase